MSKFQNSHHSFRLFLTAAAVVFFSFVGVFAQTKPLMKKTTYKTEKVELGAGGTLTLVGAPMGNVIIEGWQKNELEVSAEIEVQAENEADLAELSSVNGFMIDSDFGHVRVISVGTNDKDYLKRTAKKFPKRLLGMPFKIDYRIKVPAYCDLNVNGGRGDFQLSNVEGMMQINFIESNARLVLTGGAVSATFGKGAVEMKIPTRSWRGRSLDVQLASGNLNAYFQPNFNADLTASVLRIGKVENMIDSLKPRDRTKFTEKSFVARNGAGGALINFTVGDGNIKMAFEEKQ
jgi:hypothetical protein